MATLTGKITDVTSSTPESISSITVKAPSARIGGGTDVIVSSPATVDFNRDTGAITISGLTGGLSWLFIEGDGWTDSIALAVAEGMATLVEAIANAAGTPGMVDFLDLINGLYDRIDEIAREAAADHIDWDKGVVPAGTASLDELDLGAWGVASSAVATALGLPGLGTLSLQSVNTGRSALFIAQENSAQELTVWASTRSGDGWSVWKKIYPWVDYSGELPDGASADDYTEISTWGVRQANDNPGLPVDGAGTLEVLFTGGRAIQRFTTWEVNPKVFHRAHGGTSWFSWVQAASVDDVPDYTGEPGLKTVGVTLTAGSALDGTAGRCRVLAQVTAPVTRWRVHIESRRQVFSSTADFTLGAVSVGRHTTNGAITGTQTLKSGNTAIAGNSEWVSRWITHDLSNETLIDFNVSGTGLYSYQAGAYRLNGSTWEVTKAVPAAVWIEVETYAETPVVALIGDSTGAGQGADRPVHESALHVAARKHRFIPMNYSYPGSTMQSMTNPDHHIYQRWAHLAKPDSVIIQSGSNDIHGGTATGELQTRFNNLAELARGISPVVFGATVKARYPNSGDFAAALTSHNAWVKTQPADTRDYLDFYQALSPDGTVEASDAADAAHLTTAGHAKLAAAFDTVTVARQAALNAADIDAKADKSYVDSALLTKVNTADVASIRWKKSNVTSSDTLDSLPEGTHEVRNGSLSLGLGIPFGLLGTIAIHDVGAARTASYLTTHASNPREYINSRVGGVWSGWSRHASAADIEGKADKSQLTDLATKSYVDDAISGIDTGGSGTPTYDLALLGAPVTPWETAGIVTNYAQGELYLDQVKTQINLVQKVKIGQTHLGKDINAIVIGDTSKPAVMLEGGVHGNEVAPREALLVWARKAAQFRTWIDDLCLVVVPTVNGDRTGHNRENAQNVDINRSFGDASTTEAQAVISAFDTYNPVFYLSCHEFEHTNSENEIETGNTDFEGLDTQIRTRSTRVESAIWQAAQTLGASVGSYPATQIPGPDEPITTARTWVSVVKNTPAVLIETGGGLYPKTYANSIGVHPARYNPPLERRVQLYLESLDAALDEIRNIVTESSV